MKERNKINKYQLNWRWTSLRMESAADIFNQIITGTNLIPFGQLKLVDFELHDGLVRVELH